MSAHSVHTKKYVEKNKITDIKGPFIQFSIAVAVTVVAIAIVLIILRVTNSGPFAKFSTTLEPDQFYLYGPPTEMTPEQKAIYAKLNKQYLASV